MKINSKYLDLIKVKDQLLTDYAGLFYIAFLKLALEIFAVMVEFFPLLSLIRGILNNINKTFWREGSL